MEIWKLSPKRDTFLKTPVISTKKDIIGQLKDALAMIQCEVPLLGEYEGCFIVFSEEEKQRISEIALLLFSNQSKGLHLLAILTRAYFPGMYALYITDNPKDLISDIDPSKPNKSILAVAVEK